MIDAVERAGGARNGADLSVLNLAAPLTDGTQVVVPKQGAARRRAPAPGDDRLAARRGRPRQHQHGERHRVRDALGHRRGARGRHRRLPHRERAVRLRRRSRERERHRPGDPGGDPRPGHGMTAWLLPAATAAWWLGLLLGFGPARSLARLGAGGARARLARRRRRSPRPRSVATTRVATPSRASSTAPRRPPSQRVSAPARDARRVGRRRDPARLRRRRRARHRVGGARAGDGSARRRSPRSRPTGSRSRPRSARIRAPVRSDGTRSPTCASSAWPTGPRAPCARPSGSPATSNRPGGPGRPGARRGLAAGARRSRLPRRARTRRAWR